jgi:GDPmannose 4,6-dehydratase
VWQTQTKESRKATILPIMRRPRAVITGVSGQDGAYLSQLLLTQGYEVVGIGPRGARLNSPNLRKLGVDRDPRFNWEDIDLTDFYQVLEAVERLSPTLIFNLASHSFVGSPTQSPHRTSSVTGLAPLNLLESMSIHAPSARLFQAGSSEMFGEPFESPQNESSRFNPRNIYGSSKVFAHNLVQNYRLERGLFVGTAILYNHESPLRSRQFVTRKISSTVAALKKGQVAELLIGNLSAVRDWGYAPEYVQGMLDIVQHTEPDDFILATGKPATVRDFVRLAFEAIGIAIKFDGIGNDEVGYDIKTGRRLVAVDPQFYRASEGHPLVGDPSKAERKLGWKTQVNLEETVNIMVSADLRDWNPS